MINKVKKYCQVHQIEAISVCIHQHGKELFSYQHGLIDPITQKAVDAHTRFTIGSISKLFVTVAVLQLEEKGLVDLNEPVYAYLPDFKMSDARYKQITVLMLLNHSSGLPSTSFRGKYTNHYYPEYIQDMLRMYQTLPLKSDPGKYSVYCNDGFVMAQYLVETLSQMTFRDYCKTYITTPCGMLDTEFPEAILEEGTYAKAPNEYDRAFDQEYVNGIGSGGVYSSSKDLCLFYDTFYTGKLLSKESLTKMSTLHAKSHIHSLTLNSNGYGLGFDHVELPLFKAMGYKAMAKGGATFGYLSYGYVVLEKELSVCIVSTSKEAGVVPLAKALGQSIINEPIIPNALPLPTTITNEIEGIYGASNRTYRIKNHQDRIDLEMLKLDTFIPIGSFDKVNHQYVNHGQLLGFLHPKLGFIKENDITYMYVEYEEESVKIQAVLAQKIEPSKPVHLALNGQYYLKTNEYLDQRTFYTQDFELIKVIGSKNYNVSFVPFPLKNVSKDRAVPFIELPGNYSREMCDLQVQDRDHFVLGPYHYMNANLCTALPEKIVLDTSDTLWYKGRIIKGFEKDSDIRVVGIKIEEHEIKVVYDSLYCHDISLYRMDYIGILGKAGQSIVFR